MDEMKRTSAVVTKEYPNGDRTVQAVRGSEEAIAAQKAKPEMTLEQYKTIRDIIVGVSGSTQELRDYLRTNKEHILASIAVPTIQESGDINKVALHGLMIVDDPRITILMMNRLTALVQDALLEMVGGGEDGDNTKEGSAATEPN